MSTIDFNAELAKAGANVDSRWGAVRFFIRRYPLGAVGAVIMAIFLFAAIVRAATSRSTTRCRPTPRPRWPSRAPHIGSAAISWAATSTAASSMARASR